MKKTLTIVLCGICAAAFAQDKKDKKNEGQQKAAINTTRSNIKQNSRAKNGGDTANTKQQRWGEK